MSPEGIDPQEAVYGDNYRPRKPKSSQPPTTADQQPKIKTPLQEAVRLYMSVHGVTARGLERALGIDHTAVSRFTSGRDVSLDNFAIILNWLMTKPDNPQGE